ncbi:hypothetical protein K435DRAFT_865582 [Dendrothele bispora CBS 962.96]|uniref:DUF6697 domain-containing protein n=1 Tax=Dendrothele bispora (strain CBS 962.96) TaxID=1314807 RepID=A0A4S8LKK7_DENBC|nr:hypothetical protein K435DRAFT_865582 [Dendrothele bispora CBS 962.96]
MAPCVKKEVDEDDFFRSILLTTAPKAEKTEPEIEEINGHIITDSTHRERPPKKRQVLESVIVRRIDEILQKERRMRDVGRRLDTFKNSNSKLTKKEEEMRLSDHVLHTRLKDIQLDLFPIDLDITTLNTTITRDFMSDRYGGSNIACFPKISKEKIRRHGYNDFMYLNMRFHPHAPQVPGAPGLYFRPGKARPSDTEWTENRVYRLFTRLSSGIWLKMGLYVIGFSEPLSIEEWKRNDMKTMRDVWSYKISKMVWGRGTRCSIRLRSQLGRDPTQEEYEEAFDSDNRFLDVSSQEVSNAFLLGEEVLSVWTLRCVGYDAEFQRTIARQFANWTPPPRALKKPKNATGQVKKEEDDESKHNIDTVTLKRSSRVKQKTEPLKKRKVVELEDDDGRDAESEDEM